MDSWDTRMGLGTELCVWALIYWRVNEDGHFFLLFFYSGGS